MSKNTITQHRRRRTQPNRNRWGWSGWFTILVMGPTFGAVAWAASGAPTLLS
jgi:uncharacterized membrane protein